MARASRYRGQVDPFEPARGTTPPASAPARLVVGIGASAGGLEALQRLLQALPAPTGIAFVVVVHAPPGNTPKLIEFLARATPMALLPWSADAPYDADTVLVVPPTRDSGGDAATQSGPHSIDRLFTQLAARFGRSATAVVLSGTGNDGAAGARAVDVAGGPVLVQDLATAEHASMPAAAAASCPRAERLPPEAIAARLMSLASAGHPPDIGALPPDALDEQVREILQLVRKRTGNDFAQYKTNTVLRRLDRRMKACGKATLADYRTLVETDAGEAQALARDFSIGVTAFFRDPEAFDVLRTQVLPALCAVRTPPEPVRVWDACCATGEETYSLAILLHECMPGPLIGASMQIFATDMDESAIARARTGRYPESIADDVGATRLASHFTRVDQGYQVARDLREVIVFAKHNLLRDPPFSRLDLIVCRNFLIYLAPAVQHRIVGMFHEMLRPGGYLMLGSSETLGPHADRFAAIDKRWRIFQRRDDERERPRRHSFPALDAGLWSAVHQRQAPLPREATPVTLAQRALIERYSPPFVVVDERFEALYFSPHGRRYFGVPAGEPTKNVLNMLHKELRPAVRAAVDRALARNEQAVFRSQLRRDDETEVLEIKAEPLDHTATGRATVLVVIEPVQPAPSPRKPAAPSAAPSTAGAGAAPVREDAKDALIHELEDQLRTSREDLNAALEQLATSNDGLVAANEELMSVNEEFQSTNEELETSKEELQTLNEELTTVNQELQHKVEALDRANSDIENLLDSTAIATLFLDRGLRVQRYTPASEQIFRLIASDLGRPLADLRGTIAYGSVPDDARRVLETGVPIEREVTTLDGTRHYLMRVLPYRDKQERIEGAVVTFIDLTERRQMEEELQERAQILDLAHILVRDLDDRIVLWNHGAEALYGYARDLAVGRNSHELLATTFPVPYEQIAAELHERGSWQGELVHRARDGHPITVQSRWVLYRATDGTPRRILETNVDITDRKRAEQELVRSQRLVHAILDSVDEGFVVIDREQRIVTANRAYRVMAGETEREIVGLPCRKVGYGALVPGGDGGRGAHPLSSSVVPTTTVRRQAGPDGATHHFEVKSFPLRTPSGDVDSVVEVFSDITGRRLLDEERLKSQKLEAIGTLAGGIAHDFNNLLQGIFGYLSLAKHKLAAGAPASELLSNAESALRMARGLASQLLTFAKGGAPVRRLLEPRALIADAVKFAMSGSNIGYRLDLPDDLLTIEADEAQLAQVVQNIVLNAAQATASGGTVEVRARNLPAGSPRPSQVAAGPHIAIAVIDRGAGIPPETLPRIFDPYFTTKRDGSGLGLATAYAIVGNHGGHIDVATRAGEGSTFTVYLPASTAKPPVEPPPAQLPDEPARILVMDDDALVRDVARRMIGAMGYSADVAADGAEAVAKYGAALAAGRRYDAVILDLTVRAGLGGLETLAQLRAIDADVRAIVSSGYSDDSLTADVADHGFRASLAKPYTGKDLREALASALRDRA